MNQVNLWGAELRPPSVEGFRRWLTGGSKWHCQCK